MSPGTEPEPIIQLDGLGKYYGTGAGRVDALRDVSLRLVPGRSYAVTGSSGSGKSTLLNVLGLLETPSHGQYRLAGRDTSRLAESERTRLRSQVLGFVFQSFHLVPYLSSVENVALPLSYHPTTRHGRLLAAREALGLVGLSHRLDARSATLSGGERQRVAIARAVVHQPAVLLCDEPSGNLDADNTRRVLDLLLGMVRPDRALIVVTHEDDVAARMDQVLRLENGRVLDAVGSQ
ncbi:MAG: putative transport system ATP-binding protein [Kribbellaceae bacterium]|nr:putative transport system ATP-binding protein [Kribbellaceae bacterium]